LLRVHYNTPSSARQVDWPELENLPDSARQTLQNLYDYLHTHRDHIDYARFKELGLPIGSGLVESACMWLIQQRFKGVGMLSSTYGRLG
jgi:hypothetical protein